MEPVIITTRATRLASREEEAALRKHGREGLLLRSRACAGLLFAFFYSLLSSRSRPTTYQRTTQRCAQQTAKWRWTCSHVADAAPEWPALLAATTTATLMLRAYPSYPTVALFHVSLTLRKNLKRRAAESPTSRSA